MYRCLRLLPSGVSRHFFGLAATLGFVLALATQPAWSQVTASGSVVGQVVDQSNAAIPGAEVKLLDESTNSVQTATTNDAGRYVFINVAPGTYDITVSKDGFTTFKVNRQQVQVGVTLTMNATVGQTITGLQLQSLPTLGRDANSFYTLQPGVLPTGQVAGAVADQNMYQLDGGNNSSDMDGNNAVYTNSSGSTAGGTGGTPSGVMPTPIESIEEFRVGTNN